MPLGDILEDYLKKNGLAWEGDEDHYVIVPAKPAAVPDVAAVPEAPQPPVSPQPAPQVPPKPAEPAPQAPALPAPAEVYIDTAADKANKKAFNDMIEAAIVESEGVKTPAAVEPKGTTAPVDAVK